VVQNKEHEMRSLISKIQRFVVSEDGPTAVEYAVMLGLIVVAIVGVVGSLATSVSGTFSSVSSALGS
jgi:pilus assembly protein Flp/PilA